MKAMVYTETGGLEVLKIQDIPKPKPNDNQVLIAVKAGALNIADYQRFETLSNKVSLTNRLMNWAMGFKGSPIGAEISGIVVQVGKNVNHVQVGDHVFGKTAGSFPKGGFAEYALLDKERVNITPRNFSFEQASAVSISFETALGAVRKANIKKGMDVMIYGSSGGVGLYAVQIAKAMGANVTGVCSTRNIETAKQAGCDTVIDYKKENFMECGKKFDVIIGINGYNPMKKYKLLLKKQGVFVGVGNAKQGFSAMFYSFISKNFTYLAGMATIQKGYLEYAKELAETDKLKPYIDKIYSVQDTPKAIQYIITNHARGKVVIKMDF